MSVLPANPEEDVITFNLRSLLTKDAEARLIFYHLEYQFEPERFTPDGLAFSKGQIDLAVLLDQGCTRYLAYECKRLNVHYKGERHPLATPYVNQGVKRFITEQYAEGLPVGCMLGYVLDSDIDFARGRVYTAIDTNKGAIGLTDGPVSAPSIADVERFTTDLTRQWITEIGPFKFEYRWLSQKGSDQDIQRLAERCFESVYGVSPSKVSVLKS